MYLLHVKVFCNHNSDRKFLLLETHLYEFLGRYIRRYIPRTLYKKDWLFLMFLLSSFMASIYSIISIETRLVTHFSGHKTITLHEKAMLNVLNHDFRFFAYGNIAKFCRSIQFALVTLIYQTRNVVYSLCFEKQTLELLLHLSFKAKLPTDGL